MVAIELTSKDNPLLKLIQLVASQARKAPPDLVLAEGIRSLQEAVAARREIEAVLFSAEFGSLSREAALLAGLAGRGIKLYRTSVRLLRRVSEVQNPQGILGLVRVPHLSLSTWRSVPDPLILCACGLQDPGNLGTLIRTGAAADISLLCTVPGTVSARNPKAIRASAGTFFRLPIVEHVELSEFLKFCDGQSVTPYLAETQGKRLYTDVDYRVGSAVLLGNEARGLDLPSRSRVESIRIPMASGVESLNVGVAGALVLFEAFNQRARIRGCRKGPRPFEK
jgi:TrmH family RNA methyltransferase